MPIRPPNNLELEGEQLYGENLSDLEIAEWFEDEREAYAELGSGDRTAYSYPYHALNARHGFRHLPEMTSAHAVGVGSAYRAEFAPIQDRITSVTIVEPSTALRKSNLSATVEYRVPSATGELPVESESADLALCFGVLHHLPNVSKVIAEIGRILRRVDPR